MKEALFKSVVSCVKFYRIRFVYACKQNFYLKMSHVKILPICLKINNKRSQRFSTKISNKSKINAFIILLNGR